VNGDAVVGHQLTVDVELNVRPAFHEGNVMPGIRRQHADR
jgi:hypothetical protein